jgi:hypothetical protein
MEVETANWQQTQVQQRGQEDLREIQIQSFLLNADETKLVPPLKEARASLSQKKETDGTSGESRRAAVALQEQWDSWLAQREGLREGIKRGNECLDQARHDLAITRQQIEEWPAYEWHCGKNPLPEFIHSIWISERIEQFLPGWLLRQEEKLNALNR